MNGRWIVGFLGVAAALAGAAMYYLQVYAYYTPARFGDGGVVLQVETPAGPVPLAATDATGIDSDSSPIRFRACFAVPEAERLAAAAIPADNAVPLTAPGWFDCFDAGQIGDDLDAGLATAVLGQAHVQYGIDRIVALYPDGRGVAWDQINACGREVFDGNPPPPGCPPAPDAD